MRGIVPTVMVMPRLPAAEDIALLKRRDPPSDIDRASDALRAKQRPLNKLFAYYEGAAGAPYLSRRIRQLLQGLNISIAENWSEVVIDACLDRITLEGLAVDNDEFLSASLAELWAEHDLGLEAKEVHRAQLVAGESFLILGLDDDNKIDAYYNDPRHVVTFYEGARPNVERYAAKWWVDEDRLDLHMQLYYPDRFEFYICDDPRAQQLKWVEESPPVQNPHGIIPVFHFRSQLRRAKSDLEPVIPLQDASNMTLLNMLAASEFSALPIKYIIAAAEMDPSKLQALPNRIWMIPPGDGGQPSQVGQLPAADFDPFLKQLDRYVQSIVTISRTPRHYLVQSGGDPSGEALLTMEAPLNKKAQDRIDVASPEWKQAGAFLAKLAGIELLPHQVTPLFKKPETIQPRTQAEIDGLRMTALKAKLDIGVPLEQVLIEAGYDKAEAKKWAADAEAKKAEAQRQLAQQQAQQPPPAQEDEEQ